MEIESFIDSFLSFVINIITALIVNPHGAEKLEKESRANFLSSLSAVGREGRTPPVLSASHRIVSLYISLKISNRLGS